MLALGPMGAQGPEQGMIAARPVCPVDRYAPESLMTIEFSVTNNVFARDILTVAQLNQAVGQLLERSIPAIWVRGEISNFTQAASGHWYFTIRTAAPPCGRSCSAAAPARWGSSLGPATRSRSGRACRCTNRAATTSCRSTPCGGPGWATCTKPFCGSGATGVRGAVRPGAQARAGAAAPGDRRDHLAARGALRDVLSALARRAPQVPVIIYPAPVQGADAAGRLAAQVRLANQRAEVDTLLLVRGGGSIEDLWSFNDEALAREVAASAIPVVSGVGHETDFTIVDFVADLRAPTPTAAAELACTPRGELLGRVMDAARTLARGQQRRLERAAQRLDRAAGQLVSPAQRLEHQRERLNSLGFRLASAWSAPQGARSARRLARATPGTSQARHAPRGRTRGERRAATGPGPRAAAPAGAQPAGRRRRALRALDQAIRWRGDMRLPATRRDASCAMPPACSPDRRWSCVSRAAARRPKSPRSGRSPTRPEQDAWSGPQAPGSTVSCKANTCCEKRLLGPSPACWPLER